MSLIDSVEDACPELLILRNPLVAHALMRAVFALLRTPVATEPKRSHECERGTQECVRHVTVAVRLAVAAVFLVTRHPVGGGDRAGQRDVACQSHGGHDFGEAVHFAGAVAVENFEAFPLRG